MSQIYTAVLGPLITLLVCFATGSFMVREGGRSLTNRLFGIINLLIFLMAFVDVLAYVLPQVAAVQRQLVLALGLFLPPVSLHLVLAKLGLRYDAMGWLYLLAIVLALLKMGGWDVLPIFWLLSAVVLAAMLTLEYRTLVNQKLRVDRICLIGLDLLLVLALLSLSYRYPLTNLSFLVIPLVAYGLVQDLDRELLKRGLLSSLLLTVLLLPIAANLTLLLRHVDELRLDHMAEWLYPYGLTPLLTLVVCLTIVIISFQQAHSRTENLLLTIFAMLWAALNLRDLMLVVMPVSASVQTFETGSLFQAGLLCVGTHLISRLVGVRNPRIQVGFYGLSLGMVLFGLLPGGDPVLYPAASGEMLAKGHRIYLYLFSMGAGICYCFAVLLIAMRRTQQVGFRLKIVMASTALALLIFLGNLPTYLGWRNYPFNYLNGLPLFLLALGVFDVSGRSMAQVFSRALRVCLGLIYLAMVPIVLWLINNYTPADLSGRYLFWSWIVNYSAAELGGSYLSWSLPALFSCLMAGFLSLAVLKLEQSRIETLVFSLACFCYASLNFDILMATVLANEQVALSISRLDHLILTVLLLGVQVQMIHLVCGVKHDWLVKVCYGIGFVVAPFTQTELYFTGMQRFAWGYFASQGPLYSLMCLLWLLGSIYGGFLMTRSYLKQTDPQQRRQLSYFMVGFCLTAALSLTNLPISYGYAIYPCGTLVFISLSFVMYGLFRNNIRAAMQLLRRLLFAGGLLVLMALLYYLPLVLPLGGHDVRHFLGLLLLLVLGVPLSRVWNSVLSLFIPHAADGLRQEFRRLSNELSLCRSRQDVYSYLSRWLFEVLGCNQCQVLLRQDESCFEGWRSVNPTGGLFAAKQELVDERVCFESDHPLLSLDLNSLMWEDSLEVSQLKASGQLQDNDYLMPVGFQGRLTAIVVVGGKLNGSPFFFGERQTLRAVAELLGAHLENARLLESLEATIEERTMELNLSLTDAMLKEKELRASTQVISRQNQIMRLLIETSSRIQQLDDVEQIMNLGLEQIHRLFNDQGSLIIIEPENRPVFMTSRGLDANVEAFLLDNRSTLLEGDINRRLADALLVVDDNLPGFTALPLKGLVDQVIGKALVRIAVHEENDLGLLELFLNRVSVHAQNRLLIDELERLASSDGLTGPFNRAHFSREFERAASRHKRYPQDGFSLMIIDINGLKEVNDSYGHLKGDEMIVSVAEYLKHCCRTTDVIARLGGDEFAVLMPSTDRAGAEHLLARFRSSRLPLVCEKSDGGVETLEVSFSIGLAATDAVGCHQIDSERINELFAVSLPELTLAWLNL